MTYCSDAFKISRSAKSRSPIQGLVHAIGPLDISLNAQENVMKIFHPVFKWIYEKEFPKCKLADNPKPWRTSLIFETVYGDWTKIRNIIPQRFEGSGAIHISMLLNLIDNYLSLVLTIYAISFELGGFIHSSQTRWVHSGGFIQTS